MKTLVIGDIHGCLAELKALIAKAGPVDQIISCGDLIDRGPDSLGVIEFCKANQIQVCLGNHEHMALEALTEYESSTTFRRLNLTSSDWFANGGAKVFPQIEDQIPSIIEYFQSLPLFIQTEHTHNGLPVVVSHSLLSRTLTGLTVTPTESEVIQAIWNRQLPLSTAKYFNIHGHTPTDYFSELQSAPRQPIISNYHLNLDTGCCYAIPSRGVLTGVILPDMQIIQQERL